MLLKPSYTTQESEQVSKSVFILVSNFLPNQLKVSKELVDKDQKQEVILCIRIVLFVQIATKPKCSISVKCAETIVLILCFH